MKIRSPKHRKFVRDHDCTINDGKGNNCNGSPVVAHHLTFCGGHGMGLKESDEWVVPLCHSHHINLHHIGERKWWSSWGIDAKEEAINLARVSPCNKIREASNEL